MHPVSDWRSGPESNRHTRICSPMHHHSATGPPVAVRAISCGDPIAVKCASNLHSRPGPRPKPTPGRTRNVCAIVASGPAWKGGSAGPALPGPRALRTPRPGNGQAACRALCPAGSTITKSSCTCATRVVSFRPRRDGCGLRSHSLASPDQYVRYPVAKIRPACSNRQAA